MSKNRFAGIGGHQSSKARTVEWLTPPAPLAAIHKVMGRMHALDPCSPIVRPWPTAERHLTKLDNGLIVPWDGDVWLNPPYTASEIGRWLSRLADHGDGMGLIFARTETEAFFEHVWKRADAVRFMRGRVNFHFGERWQDPKTGRWYEVGDEAPGNAGAPTVLCAYGQQQCDVLAACDIEGQFIPLRFPRSVLVSIFSPSNDAEKSDITWRQALREFFEERSGPITLPEIYAAFASHPKTVRNPNWNAKIRQQLQLGDYRQVQRGLWEVA